MGKFAILITDSNENLISGFVSDSKEEIKEFIDQYATTGTNAYLFELKMKAIDYVGNNKTA